MNHSFDIAHAEAYGIPAAILIDNFAFWIIKNRANGTHFRDGRTWSYNSVKAFKELFPYMGIKQIRGALDTLVAKGVLVKRDLNEGKADRTLWYAFVNEEAFIGTLTHLPKRANGLPKRDEAFAQKGKPTNRTDINADITTDKPPRAAARPAYSALDTLVELGVDEQFASDWLEVRKARNIPPTKSTIDSVLAALSAAGYSPADGIKLCAQRGWGIFNKDWLSSSAPASRQAPAARQSRHSGFDSINYGEGVDENGRF